MRNILKERKERNETEESGCRDHISNDRNKLNIFLKIKFHTKTGRYNKSF